MFIASTPAIDTHLGHLLVPAAPDRGTYGGTQEAMFASVSNSGCLYGLAGSEDEKRVKKGSVAAFRISNKASLVLRNIKYLNSLCTEVKIEANRLREANYKVEVVALRNSTAVSSLGQCILSS